MKIARTIFLLLFSLFLLITTNQTISAQELPAKVKSYLDKTYSGWKASTLAKSCGKTTNAVIREDFDGNGRTDYTVKIKHGRKGYIIAFLSKVANFKPFVLESTSSNNIDDTAMDLVEGKIHVDKCELYSYTYIYRSGKFVRN